MVYIITIFLVCIFFVFINIMSIYMLLGLGLGSWSVFFDLEVLELEMLRVSRENEANLELCHKTWISIPCKVD